MNFSRFVAFLKENVSSLLLGGLFVAAGSFFFLTLSEKHFKTTTDFMVVQTGNANQDFYTLFKTAEYLSKALSEGIESERFIAALVATGKVNSEFLPFDKKERLTAWRDMVSVRKDVELGMLRVSVTSDAERMGENIMKAVGEVLVKENSLFRGGDEKSVEVRILSGPVTERNPSFREIALVAMLAFLGGAFLTGLTILFRKGELPTARRKLSIPRDYLSSLV